MLLLTLGLLTGTAWAADMDIPAAQSEALDLDGLQAAGEEWAPGMELNEGLDLEEGIQSILDTGSGQVAGVVRKALRSGVLLLSVVLLCGLAEGTCAVGGSTVDVVSIVGAMAIAAVAVADAGQVDFTKVEAVKIAVDAEIARAALPCQFWEWVDTEIARVSEHYTLRQGDLFLFPMPVAPQPVHINATVTLSADELSLLSFHVK